MRTLVAVIVLLGLVSPAHAGDPLKPYVGRIVISPEAPPSVASELPAYLAANAVKGDEYDLVKGPPWPMHLVGVLARNVTKPLQLVFTEKGAKTPLVSVDVTSKQRIVIAHTEATIAAEFAAGKTYSVRLMLGKTALAKAEITLRD